MSRLFSDHFLAGLTPDERTLVEKLRTLCDTRIGPAAARVAQDDVFAWDNFRLLVEEGIIATAFPREYGGTDSRQAVRIRLIEELGRVCSASASLVTGADLSTRAITAGASDEWKRRLLPGLCSGELQAAFGLTEPGAGSDVRSLRTLMKRDGGDYIVTGEKKFITRAGTADWLVIVGRLAADNEQFIAVLIHRDSPGVTISDTVPKLGWYGVPIASIVLDGVRVPCSQRLGAEGDGFALAQDALVRARIGHASMALGRAIGAVEIASAYATDRNLFGRTLGSHQGVQWMLADMVTKLEASRALVAAAAGKYDNGDEDAAIFASMAKLHATDLGMAVVTDALQLTGGRGFLQDFPLSRFFRDAKLNQIGEGSSEVHKTVIGRSIVRRIKDCDRNPALRDGPLTDY